MRSSKGMFAIAKANAIDKGLTRSWGDSSVIGFALTYEELERIYAKEGYALRSSKGGSGTDVINNHIYNWKLAGLVRRLGDKIFFVLDSEDLEDWQAWRYIQEFQKAHPGNKFDVVGLDVYIKDGEQEAEP